MGACDKYLDAIYEETIGALSFERKKVLYEHLLHCEFCRAEREALLGLKRAFLKEVSKSRLHPQEAAQIKAQVLRQIASQGHGNSLWSQLKNKVGLRGLIPALAAACLIFLLVGVRGPQEGAKLTPVTDPESGITDIDAKITEKELAIIEHLELLEQLDTVKLLVKVVDNKEII